MDDAKEEKNTTDVQPAHPDQPANPKPIEKYKSFIIKQKVPIIAALIVALVAAFVFLFQLSQDKNNENSTGETSPSPTTAYAPLPTLVPTVGTKESIVYKTRFYDPKVDFVNFDGFSKAYPTELTSIPESELTPTACTNYYRGYGDDFKTTVNEVTSNLTDPTLLSYIKTLNNLYDQQMVYQIMSCNMKDGKTVILYSLGPCGGGCSGIPHVTTVQSGQIKKGVPISFESPYASCSKPLQTTSGKYFYFTCGGGDGGFSNTGIFQYNLDNNTASEVLLCEFITDFEGHKTRKCD